MSHIIKLPKLNDLSLYDFLDAITNKKIEYEFIIKPSLFNDNDKQDTITGDKYSLIEYVEMLIEALILKNPTHPSVDNFKRIVEQLTQSNEYAFEKEVSELEIYNYLDHITKGFDIERVELILWDIDIYYNSYFLERINKESQIEYIENDWKIPQKEIVFNGKNGKQIKSTVTDFKTMRAKTHIAEGYSIGRAIDMLNKKLNEKYPIQQLIDVAGKQKGKEIPHFTHPLTNTQRQNLFNGLVSGGFIPKGTSIEHFNFVFGGAETADFKPLLWLKDNQDLKIFIDTFFPNEKSKWKKTVACFKDNQGKEINYNSIRNLNPAHKDNPPSEAYFKKLKKEI